MSGTTEGGIQASKTNRKLYGADFYSKIGAKGGRNGHTGGFYQNRELAIIAGSKGGTISRRGQAKKPVEIKQKTGVWMDIKRRIKHG